LYVLLGVDKICCFYNTSYYVEVRNGGLLATSRVMENDAILGGHRKSRLKVMEIFLRKKCGNAAYCVCCVDRSLTCCDDSLL